MFHFTPHRMGLWSLIPRNEFAAPLGPESWTLYASQKELVPLKHCNSIPGLTLIPNKILKFPS